MELDLEKQSADRAYPILASLIFACFTTEVLEAYQCVLKRSNERSS
jgi:hypothetical protein